MQVIPKWTKVAAVLVLTLAVAAVILKATDRYWRPETMNDALDKMRTYKQKGRYDEAIAAGTAYVAKHPNNGANDQVFGQVALLYVEEAKRDTNRKEQLLREAVRYRDLMLPVASDTTLGWYSMAALLDSGLISEEVADVSTEQKCVQYQNALKLWTRLVSTSKDKQDELSNKKQDEFGYTSGDVDRVLNQANTAMRRVETKQRSSRCQ
jgi:tetratricopeptide (TPR) repeat protein